MSDIVERLKSWSSFVAEGYEVPAASLCMNEAAAEITKLRAELAEADKTIRDFNQDAELQRIMAINNDLLAQLAEAEAVIKPFADYYKQWSKNEVGYGYPIAFLEAYYKAAAWLEGRKG